MTTRIEPTTAPNRTTTAVAVQRSSNRPPSRLPGRQSVRDRRPAASLRQSRGRRRGSIERIAAETVRRNTGKPAARAPRAASSSLPAHRRACRAAAGPPPSHPPTESYLPKRRISGTRSGGVAGSPDSTAIPPNPAIPARLRPTNRPKVTHIVWGSRLEVPAGPGTACRPANPARSIVQSVPAICARDPCPRLESR